MQQSNVIFGAIFLAFIVFITVRGELSTYLSLLRGSGQLGTKGSLSVGSSSTGDILSTGRDLLDKANLTLENASKINYLYNDAQSYLGQ